MTQTATVTKAEIESALAAWCDHAMEAVIPDFETGSTEHFWDDPRNWAEQVVDVAFGAAVDDTENAGNVLTASWNSITDDAWEQSTEREQAVRFCLCYLVNEMSKDEEAEEHEYQRQIEAAETAAAFVPDEEHDQDSEGHYLPA